MPTTAITLIGGPTALLEYAGLLILTDPTFDPPGSYPDDEGTPLVKTAGPALARLDLPPIDLVLLSHHEHEDNLDYEGMELLATGVLTLSTMKAASELFGGNVHGLDSWETWTLGAVTVTAVPALHGPVGIEKVIGPVTGFVLEAEGEPTVYLSGDNASIPLVEQIGDRFAPVDIAILFAGAARVPEIDAALTLTSTDAARAAKALRAKRVVGLHTEDWEHFSENREQLGEAFAAAGVADLLVDVPRGVRVAL